MSTRQKLFARLKALEEELFSVKSALEDGWEEVEVVHAIRRFGRLGATGNTITVVYRMEGDVCAVETQDGSERFEIETADVLKIFDVLTWSPEQPSMRKGDYHHEIPEGALLPAIVPPESEAPYKVIQGVFDSREWVDTGLATAEAQEALPPEPEARRKTEDVESVDEFVKRLPSLKKGEYYIRIRTGPSKGALRVQMRPSNVTEIRKNMRAVGKMAKFKVISLEAIDRTDRKYYLPLFRYVLDRR